VEKLFRIENIENRKSGSNLMETNFGSSKPIKQREGNNKNIANQEQNMDIKIEVISKKDDIIKNETDRILWYLKNYERYEKLGYSEFLELPISINPKNYKREDIEKSVEEDYFKNQENYESYSSELKYAWEKMSEKITEGMKELYGFTPSKSFILAPTFYGTGGGSVEKDGIIFFKIPPKDRSGIRSTEERITHEVLAHGLTENLREGTEIDESTTVSSHPWYKERLMDLLGRTLLVRGGILKREEVKMDGDIEKQVADIVDPIYYLNPGSPDENSLRFNGKLEDLFKAVIEKIKADNIETSKKIE
jgi:hypothetical protein